MSSANTLEDSDRCSRTATTITTENVSRVEFLLENHPKLTFAGIQDIFENFIKNVSLTFFITPLA